MQDWKIALRTLAKNRGYTAIASLTLGLGVAATASMFSVVDALLNKPLDLPAVDRLVMVLERRPGQTLDWTSVSGANFADWRATARSFDTMAAIAPADANLAGEGDPEKVQAARVDGSLFATLGVPMVQGRGITAADAAGRAVVISHALWERRFGLGAVLGKEIRVNEESRTIVGVTPRGFRFPQATDLWLPLELSPRQLADRAAHTFRVVARLKPGVTLEDAQAEMAAVAARLSGAYPETNRNWGARVMPVSHFVNSDLTRQYTAMSLWSVVLLLLITCTNVANLQFARAAARVKELAVRSALGAGRGRQMKLLLTESVFLGVGGALVGILGGYWLVDLILSYMPPDLVPFIGGWERIRLDGRVLLATLSVGLLSAVAAGIAPALSGARVPLNEVLKDGARGSTGGGSSRRARSVLLVAGMALSVVLLIGAGLMVRGMQALISPMEKFAPSTLLTMAYDLSPSRYPDLTTQAAASTRFLEAVRSIAGVESAAIGTQIPYGFNSVETRFRIEGRAEEPGQSRLAIHQRVSPEYFAALRIPIRDGRGLRDSDDAGAPLVAVVSESFARENWPGQNATGRRFQVVADGGVAAWVTVVGVAGDMVYDWTGRQAEPAIYRPYRQSHASFGMLAIRTAGDPEQIAAAVRARLKATDPEQPFYRVMSWARVIHLQTVGLGYIAAILSVVGLIALAMSAAGTYGLMSHAVTERIPELGIRMVMGAHPLELARMVLGRSLLLAGSGLGLGLLAAYPLSRAIAGLVFGVSNLDLWTWLGVSFVLLMAAVAASGIPAWRAARVDPLTAIRGE